MSGTKDQEARTVAVRMSPETLQILERWRKHVGLKSDSEAIRAALHLAHRSIPGAA